MGSPGPRRPTPRRPSRLGADRALSGLGLLLLTTVAFLLRLWVSSHIFVVSQDAAHGYLYQARELLRGDWREGIGTYFSPGYPLIVAMLAWGLGDVEWAGKLVSIVSGAFLVPVVFRLARQSGDGRGAWPSAVLTATYPFLVQHSTDALTEGSYTLVLITSLWIGYRGLATRAPGAWVGVGALFGLAYHISGEAIAVLVVFVVVATGFRLSRRSLGAASWAWVPCRSWRESQERHYVAAFPRTSMASTRHSASPWVISQSYGRPPASRVALRTTQVRHPSRVRPALCGLLTQTRVCEHTVNPSAAQRVHFSGGRPWGF